MRAWVDRLIFYLGYVPRSVMDAELAERTKVEHELRRSKRDLEEQLSCRKLLEDQVSFLRELQLAHARKDSATQQAINRLDTLVGELSGIMEEWKLEAV